MKAELKDRLREAMNLRKMKAVDLCEKTDIPKGAISYYLAGKSLPKADRVYLISKALNIDEAWLLGYDVPMERKAMQKNNDAISDIIIKMRSDEEFLYLVQELSKLDKNQIASVRIMLSAFQK